jgi:Na+/proline symporter
MAHPTLDILLFVVFLALNLIIGLWAGTKVKTIREFSIGNKDFSTGTLVSTIIATSIGGGAMFYGLQNMYSKGLYFIIPLILGGSICFIFIGQVMAVRMGEFLNNLSVAEVMGDLYGKRVQFITALFGVFGAVGYIAIQFKVMGKMIAFLFDFNSYQVTIIAASIVILYSAFGGIRSVTITDVLQFVAFSIFIPILALVIWNHLQDPKQVFHVLATNPVFNLREVFTWNREALFALSMLSYFMVPAFIPSGFQRVSISKDVWQVRKAFTYSAWAWALILLGLVFIAVLLLADSNEKNPANLLVYMVENYAYPGLKGLIVVGVLAMAMSTADSHLNAAVVLSASDMLKVVRPSLTISILMIRLFSIGIGAASLVLALYNIDLLKLFLLAGSLWTPIVTVPLLLAIFGFRSTAIPVLVGMGAGLLIVMFWDRLLGHTGIVDIIPGMLANLIFLMGSHYLLRQPGGWVGIKDKAPLLVVRQQRKEWWEGLRRTIKEMRVYSYLQKNLPSYDGLYALLGLYVLGATYSLFFTIPQPMVVHYQKLYTIAMHSVLICTAAFLTYPAWPATFRAPWFITYAWPLGICYVLFVVGTQLVLMSGFNQIQVMIFLLNLVIAAMLLPWPLMVLLAGMGIVLGGAIFNWYYDAISIEGVVDSLQFKFIYAILLLSSFLIAIFRFKKAKEVLEEKNKYLETSYDASRKELVEVMGYRDEVLKELDPAEIKTFDQLTADYLKQVIYRITDYIRLDVTEVDLSKFLLEVKRIVKLKYFEAVPQLILERSSKVEKITADAAKAQILLVNSIQAIQQYNLPNNPIRLVVEEAKLGYQVGHMKNYTKEVKAVKFILTTQPNLPPSEDIYRINPMQHFINWDSDLGVDSKGMAENARIIGAHYGYSAVIDETTYVYVIPANVREVRGKVMELLREPVAAHPDEIQHPLAIQLERTLLDRLQGRQIDLTIVNKALDTIKRYHAGVKRKSGEPFFTHPIAVALILLEYCQDQDAIIAALLHDTVEDTSLSTIHIKLLFGESVAFIVGKVTNLEDNLRRMMLGDHENTKRLIDYEDKRAIYVKLADRLHNMRTIEGHSSINKQKHIAQETLNFFVPLAKNLDLAAVATELEERSLAVLNRQG